MFYDLHVKADVEKAAEMAKKLGFSGIGLIVPWEKRQEVPNMRERAKNTKGIDISFGVELSGKASDIQKIARSIRRQYELVLAKGGTEETNRTVLETPEVDILVNTNLENGQPGINHILARLGAKNSVAICFDFREVLQSVKKTRSELLSSLIETARFVRKYKCPFVLSSGALNEWDMRSPSELIAFGKFLGFDERQCKKALSGEILRENRKRLSGKWIMPGVEIE
ncbi:MAG: RNase P subunit p30 family protein [Candidatus Aenigmatarchaeota archaeon]